MKISVPAFSSWDYCGLSAYLVRGLDLYIRAPIKHADRLEPPEP